MVKKKPHLPMQETQVQSLGQEDPLEKEMAHAPVSLPGESHGQRNLAGYSPWGLKESDTTEATEHVCTRRLENLNIQHGMGPPSSG